MAEQQKKKRTPVTLVVRQSDEVIDLRAWALDCAREAYAVVQERRAMETHRLPKAS